MYFGPPKTFAPVRSAELERELGDRAADRALDPLGAERGLLVALALAPFLRAVGAADRHPHDRDRGVDAAERDDPGIRRPVRTITVPPISSRRIRFGEPTSSAPSGVIVAAFSPSPPPESRGCVIDDRVPRRPPRLQREVEARELQLEADHVRLEHSQRLLEQLLPGLVALEHDDSLRVHGAGV